VPVAVGIHQDVQDGPHDDGHEAEGSRRRLAGRSTARWLTRHVLLSLGSVVRFKLFPFWLRLDFEVLHHVLGL
jgi:hypothetical protein